MVAAAAGPEPMLAAPDGDAAGCAEASELAWVVVGRRLCATRLSSRRGFGDGCRTSTVMGGRSVDLGDGLAGVMSAVAVIDGVSARATGCRVAASNPINASLRKRANLMQPPPHRRRRNARPEIRYRREALTIEDYTRCRRDS
jgi:hypothetical protein